MANELATRNSINTRYQGSSLQRFQLDPEDDDSILKFVEQRWANKSYYKLGLEERWLETIAKYEGFSYLEYNEAIRRFQQDVNIPPWRVRLIINLTLPIVRTAACKHLRNRPIWDVLPATSDTKDVNIASLGKKVLRGYWYKHNINYEFIDLLLWLGLTGNAFLSVTWNPDIGPEKELQVKDFINPQLLQTVRSEEELVPLLQSAQTKFQAFIETNGSNIMPMGDVEVKTKSPFDVLCPFARNFREAPWVVDSDVVDLSSLVDQGFDPDLFKPPTFSDNKYLYFQRRIYNMNLFTRKAEYGNNPMAGDDSEVLRLKLWLPKSRQFPRGFYAAIAGGQVIDKGNNPYVHGQIPLIHFGTEKTPGKIWCFCNAEQAQGPIQQYQHSVSQLIEIKNMTAKPKILAPRTAMLLSSAWTSEPGEIVEFSGLTAPIPWTPPSPPRYLFDLMHTFRRDIDDIVAQRDATKGINPAGVRAAASLENLQSQDEGQLGIGALNIDTGMSLTGRMILANHAQFVREDRLYNYTGDKNRYEVIQLKQGMLMGGNQGADYFNVRVTTFSQFGLTRTGQHKFLELLLQYQVYTAQDRAKILQFIQMGHFEDEVDEYKIDRSNAYQENLIMSQGQPVPINIADHHATHLEEHREYMKGDTYRTLLIPFKRLFEIHYKLTELYTMMELVKPKVLGIKATIILAEQEGMTNLLPLILGIPQEGQGQSNEAGSSKK